MGGKMTGPKSYALPLDMDIQTITPSSVSPKQKFLVEVLLHNNSQMPFDLPASLDADKVHGPGNKGRRTFLFEITMRVTRNGRSITETHVMAVSFSSKTQVDSQMRIAPGESVLVKFEGDLNPMSKFLTPEIHNAEIQVSCKEWTIEDDKYFIEAISDELRSSNTLSISLINN